MLRFLQRRGLGHAAEDVLQELWVRSSRIDEPVRAPLAFLYMVANSLVIDRKRSDIQAARRDAAWAEVNAPSHPGHCERPLPDRVLAAREIARQAADAVADEGERVAKVFRRHRIDGLTQHQVAAELNISVTTVQGDLRRAYHALAALRRQRGEE